MTLPVKIGEQILKSRQPAERRADTGAGNKTRHGAEKDIGKQPARVPTELTAHRGRPVNPRRSAAGSRRTFRAQCAKLNAPPTNAIQMYSISHTGLGERISGE